MNTHQQKQAKQLAFRWIRKTASGWEKRVSHLTDRYFLLKTGKEFPTGEALQKYLEEHPKADKRRHWVTDEKENKKVEEGSKSNPEIGYVRKWGKARASKLESMRTGSFTPTPISGTLGAKSVKGIQKNAKKLLRTYSAHLPGDDVDNMRDFIDDLGDTLDSALSSGDFKGVKASAMDKIMHDAIEDLVFQTHESYKRQLGDHGIRHIVGNIKTQNQVYDALDKAGKKISAADRLKAMLIMVNHDLGYTAAPAATDLKYTGKHKEYGSKIFKSERGDNYQDLFGDGLDEFVHLIETHDSDEIDWDKDPVGSGIRVADNLSLYAKDKLPGLFRLVPDGLDVLEELGRAATAKPPDDDEVERIKKSLKEKVQNTGLSSALKDALLNAAQEVSRFTPRFTLGMLGGHVGSINFKDGSLVVKVKKDAYDTQLQKLFDMGQSQFNKLAKSYGVDKVTDNKFELSKNGKSVLKLSIG